MKLPFTKMQGAGNDFVVIDATRAPFRPTPQLLTRLTDRRFGIGCDQVLVVEPPSTPDVDFNYRIFNADGSEVGQCGNGSRCFARFVHEHGLSDKNPIRVRTSSSVLELRRVEGGEVRVNMGVPRLTPGEVPFRADQRAGLYELTLPDGERVVFAAVSMGNPHAVIAVEDVERAPVERLGRALQAQAAFPQSVNVGFLQIDDSAHAALRVYERGAGETLACGSGACAAVVAGRLWGRLAERVDVRVRGGVLKIEWAGEGQPVWMTGPAETVFSGEIEWQS
ncbi:MAG: diaminopimelate epimerase [Nevskiaceae bacterium]|nr:MAG: diaminopimelate epimerase [Nevskiaceae bacterium]